LPSFTWTFAPAIGARSSAASTWTTSDARVGAAEGGVGASAGFGASSVGVARRDFFVGVSCAPVVPVTMECGVVCGASSSRRVIRNATRETTAITASAKTMRRGDVRATPRKVPAI
jgi:hypothetical protein